MRRAGYKREQFAQKCPEANFLREELIVPRDGPLAGFNFPTLRQKSRFRAEIRPHTAPQQSALEPAVSFRPSDIVAWRENGAYLRRSDGSTIVDGPEVYEDRDSAQREAEGPRASMDARPLDLNYNIRHRLRNDAPTPLRVFLPSP